METTHNQNDGIRDAGAKVASDVENFANVARERGTELAHTGRQWVLDHPIAAVAAAFGVGYVLAGGLVSKTTLRLVQMGAKLYLRKVIGEALGNTVSQFMGGSDSVG